MSRRNLRLLALVVAALLAWLAREGSERLGIGWPPEPAGAPSLEARAPADLTGAAETNAALHDAIRSRRSGVMVDMLGPVVHLLPDDLRGSRHQRFLVDVEAERAVLVSHNIDLAPRIDALRKGDSVRVRGQFEWNEKGGVVHWTHHDPDGRRPGGFVEHEGRTYR